MEDLAPLHVAAPFSFEFREPLRAPNPLLVLEGADAGYPGNTVLRGINFSLQSEQRYGLLGINGAGKSTLIKTIAGELPPLKGSAIFNKGLSVGYFAQHQVEMLRDDQSPAWHLQRIAQSSGNAPREQDLRNFLGGFNFSGEMATGSIAHFSGGEKARLALALIVWTRPNLLLLDEPTNHLDLETREALTVALAQFEGTLVLVSHDRHLLRATTDQFLIVANGRLEPFDGDLDDYRDWLLRSKLEKPVAPPEPPQKKKSTLPPSSSARRSLEARVKRLEEMIGRLNAQKSAIEARLADPALYQEPSGEAVQAVLRDQAYVAKELSQLESEWLDKQAELEHAAG
jgi:ATP-binding cassette subfamily F protein 3